MFWFQIKTVAVPKDEKAVITEFKVKDGLIVLTTLLNAVLNFIYAC